MQKPSTRILASIAYDDSAQFLYHLWGGGLLQELCTMIHVEQYLLRTPRKSSFFTNNDSHTRFCSVIMFMTSFRSTHMVIAGTMWWLLPCWITIYFSLAPACLMDDANCFRVLHLSWPCPLCCNESLLWHWWNSCMYYSHGGCETCWTSTCHHLPKKIQLPLSTVTGLDTLWCWDGEYPLFTANL